MNSYNKIYESITDDFSLADGIEALIDEFGLEMINESISLVCCEKSKHVMQYDDRILSRQWKKNANKYANLKVHSIE